MSFSTANMAVVAYALVKADGTSPEINSGVETTRLGGPGTGYYAIILPGNPSQQEVLQQGQGDPISGFRHDLIFACPINGGALTVGTGYTGEFIRTIQIENNAGGLDSDFAVMILRTTIPTPTDSSGNQDGPV
jgi:hypothetical protein